MIPSIRENVKKLSLSFFAGVSKLPHYQSVWETDWQFLRKFLVKFYILLPYYSWFI